MKGFRELLREKIVVFDGAMGTSIQAQNPTPDDYGGERYAGCNEYLVLSRPEMVRKVHAGFLEAGADVIETDTFGATSVVLAEYGLEKRVFELNAAAARLAKEVAAGYSTTARPRFVAGSMGPTTKLPTLGHISFGAMEQAFFDQAGGLAKGGADLLVIETCQDLLQAKAALAGVRRYFADAGRTLPVIVSVTVEQAGTMLLGTEIGAALTALEPFGPDMIGMNCATGPKEMSESIRHLCRHSSAPVFVMPNAGIPENIGGHAHYHLTPEELVRYLRHFVTDLGVSAVGGCCGTTPVHIRALAESVGSLPPPDRKWTGAPGCSSLYQHVPYRTAPAPTLIGERTNANGSRKFRGLLAAEDWEAMTAMGKDQAREGAHILDVCVAFVGRDEARDMREFIPRLNTQVTLPIMIDSTESPVIEEALMRISGKAIVNSVNFEDGGERLRRVLGLCRKYGAAVVALTIDEQGMAKSVERKVEIARRILETAVGAYGLRESDVIFDPLTFTLGSGDPEFREAGVNTIAAIREIKKLWPDVQTSLGVSNISFGLDPRARHVLNSVFLHYAIEAGLDMAIVHASKILPLYRIPEEEREVCRRLIFNERPGGVDPLERLLGMFSGGTRAERAVRAADAPVEERLKERVIDGNKVGLTEDLDTALKTTAALDIINGILLDGMKTVGELFGSGQMQLPFVLQSAEVMKSAVAYLEKFMDKADATSKGTIVLATVRGDVHDIGKNLVDIILTNNGYTVINLGIQCALEKMLQAWRDNGAHAIGMSGLLVKSTLIMKENLEVLTERGLKIPVILGGAALTRRYVEQDLNAVYPGRVFYARDAFDGLRLMERIGGGIEVRGVSGIPPESGGAGAAGENDDPGTGYEAKILLATSGSTETTPARTIARVPIPLAPFFGTKVKRDVPLREVYRYVNETALIRGQWQVKRGKLPAEEYRRLLDEKIYPELKHLQDEAERGKLLRPDVVYGYYPCRSDGNDLVVFAPDGQADPSAPWDPREGVPLREILRFTFPRQKKDRRLSIADFFIPGSDGEYDVLGIQLVTVGAKASEHAKTLFDSGRYREYLYFHGLGVETAEGLAEYWHKIVRGELGIGTGDAPEIKKLFGQQYRGSRYSFGYPACPALEDQEKLFVLLKPGRIGVTLTEEFQLVPEQSTSAIIVHHPEARYFTL
ncbi:MAG TPA: methionine synthase [Bacteroidota bacterium]|nr:methionine synthase [Bacteroidota bacterium]